MHQINLRQTEKPFIVPKYEIIIKEDLTFICAIYGWVLLAAHSIYCKYNHSVTEVTVANLLNDICNYSLCEGVGTDIQLSDGILNHVLPCEVDVNHLLVLFMSRKLGETRNVLFCIMMVPLKCPVCRETIRKEEKKKKRFKLNITTPQC